MANFNSQFSLEIEHITSAEAAWITADLESVYPEGLDAIAHAEFCAGRGLESLTSDWPDFGWGLQEDETGLVTLELYADECFNLDHLVSFVQRFLKQFRPTEVVQVTWADTCTDLLPGAFGGGWAVISAAEMRCDTTADAADRAAKLLVQVPGPVIAAVVEAVPLDREA